MTPDPTTTKRDLVIAHAAKCRADGMRPLPADLCDLSGADLSGADLRGTDLRGTDLSGAKRVVWVIAEGRVIAVTGTHYWAWSYPTADGRVLEYGCESRLLADWEANVAGLCAQHVGVDRSPAYEREIRALLALCATLDGGAKQ